MDMQRITGTDSPYYEESRALYYRAFPRNEQMDMGVFLDKTQETREIYAFSEGGRFAGFAAFMNALDISHIIYFAVEEALRGKGAGGRILEKISREKAGKRLVVDVEAAWPEKPDAEERANRQAFYFRNGFSKTDIAYNWQAEDYEILVRGGNLPREDFNAFWGELFHGRKYVKVAAAVILKDNRIFATQRGYGEYKDWWEFPGGKLEPGETAEQALAREIREELDTEIEVGEWLTTVEYDYPKFHLSMDCFLCRVIKGKLTLKEHEAARWLSAQELQEVQWLPADTDVLEIIKQMLSEAEASR